MATNFRVTIGKIGLLAFIRSLDIPKRIALSPSNFKMFICDDLATLCINLVNFSPVTPEFTKVKYVHPVVSFSKINLSDKLSQDPRYRFSPYFHRMADI